MEWSKKKETPAHIKKILKTNSQGFESERQAGGNLNLFKNQIDTTNPHFNSCYICDDPGHFAKNCPNKVTDKSDYECYNCGKKGHIAKECHDNEYTKKEPKPKTTTNKKKSKPKKPFYFTPKGENKNLANMVEAVVVHMKEKTENKSTNGLFKITGYQEKNDELISIDNTHTLDKVSGNRSKFSKIPILRQSPYLVRAETGASKNIEK